jgi:hypothetical protein
MPPKKAKIQRTNEPPVQPPVPVFGSSEKSAPIVSQFDADYSAFVAEPVLCIIRKMLLQDRPLDVLEYICRHHSQIHSEILAAAASALLAIPSARGCGAAACTDDRSEPSVISISASTSTAAAPAHSRAIAATAATNPSTLPAEFSSSDADETVASTADPTPMLPLFASARVFGSVPLNTASNGGGKFDTFVMPCGDERFLQRLVVAHRLSAP